MNLNCFSAFRGGFKEKNKKSHPFGGWISYPSSNEKICCCLRYSAIQSMCGTSSRIAFQISLMDNISTKDSRRSRCRSHSGLLWFNNKKIPGSSGLVRKNSAEIRQKKPTNLGRHVTYVIRVYGFWQKKRET